jgi:SulP family sulfate permease
MTASTLDTRSTASRILPGLHWLRHYRRANLTGDVMAGIIVTIMMVPQAMAYALLAGLPPEMGLYASIVPLAIYGLLGTSPVLSVGPTAVTSLLVFASVSTWAAPGSAEYIGMVVTLALMVGLIRLGLGLLRAGFLVNFLSQPVLSGFSSAVAIVIGVSQLKHALGLSVPNFAYTHETLWYVIQHVHESNPYTIALSVLAVGILLFFSRALPGYLKRAGLPSTLSVPIIKSGPLVAAAIATLLVGVLSWQTLAGVAVVGAVPAGLPRLVVPGFDLAVWERLLPAALSISLIGFAESISVGKLLASKRRDKIDANQELIALGAANIGAALTGALPVTGGLSRSVVNYTAGANTGLASLITAGLTALTVTFFMPLFHDLPQAVLAAIILVAITNLFDVATLRYIWRYSRIDSISLLATFFAVLLLGIETGLLVGVSAALALYLWRTSRPHIAIVGRVGDSEHFRNVRHYPVTTCPHVLTVRVDESLYFANVGCLETFILNALAENPKAEHVVLVCSAVNHIDTSALETLTGLLHALRQANVTLYLAEVKEPVMRGLRRVNFVQEIGENRIFLSTDQAMRALACHPQ